VLKHDSNYTRGSGCHAHVRILSDPHPRFVHEAGTEKRVDPRNDRICAQVPNKVAEFSQQDNKVLPAHIMLIHIYTLRAAYVRLMSGFWHDPVQMPNIAS